MEWQGARNSDWSAVMTTSVLMTKCSEEQKEDVVFLFHMCSFLLYPEANSRLGQLVAEEASWGKDYLLLA